MCVTGQWSGGGACFRRRPWRTRSLLRPNRPRSSTPSFWSPLNPSIRRCHKDGPSPSLSLPLRAPWPASPTSLILSSISGLSISLLPLGRYQSTDAALTLHSSLAYFSSFGSCARPLLCRSPNSKHPPSSPTTTHSPIHAPPHPPHLHTQSPFPLPRCIGHFTAYTRCPYRQPPSLHPHQTPCLRPMAADSHQS